MRYFKSLMLVLLIALVFIGNTNEGYAKNFYKVHNKGILDHTDITETLTQNGSDIVNMNINWCVCV